MKTELLLLAMIDEEYLYRNKIFLHKYGKGWIAYEHSIVLLHRYFAPIKTRTVILGPARLMYSVCYDMKWLQQRVDETEGMNLVYKNPDEIIIYCPTSVTETEILRLLDIIKSRDRILLLDSVCQFFRKIWMKYNTHLFMKNIYMEYGK